MIEEEMGSEFGSVIIDDVQQRQAAVDGFPSGCVCTNCVNGVWVEVTFVLSD